MSGFDIARHEMIVTTGYFRDWPEYTFRFQGISNSTYLLVVEKYNDNMIHIDDIHSTALQN